MYQNILGKEWKSISLAFATDVKLSRIITGKTSENELGEHEI
jgi:hypothetical protein